MLTILGWAIAGVLVLFILGIYLWVRLCSYDPMGMNTIRRRVADQANRDMHRMITQGERSRQILAAREDARYAKQLRELQEEV